MDEHKIIDIIHSFRSVQRVFYQVAREEADELESTVIQIMVLSALWKTPHIGLGELADQLQVGNSTMSGIIERLVKQGLVTRERDKNDRRSLTMTLTEQGKKKKAETHEAFMTRFSTFLDISDEDYQHLITLHEQIIEKLEQSGDEVKNVRHND